MNLILLGAPGAGKGTQAEMICDRLRIPQISTGNIIREAVKQGTEMGLRVKSYLDSGDLVPDDVIIGILKERLSQDDCKNGFILDGVPRTVEQAEAIDRMGIRVDKVIDIEVGDEAIMTRLSGRRMCQDCGSSYHISYKPSAVDGICDRCGGKLITRKDDEAETVSSRLKVYHDMTEPLKAYYQQKGKLRVVTGQEEVADTTRLTQQALED